MPHALGTSQSEPAKKKNTEEKSLRKRARVPSVERRGARMDFTVALLSLSRQRKREKEKQKKEVEIDQTRL